MSRLYGLDALRGLAALAVAVHHGLQIAGRPSPIAPFLAVDLFFILSGFIMARTYEERMRDGLTTPQFLAIRYRRLFRPLAVGVTIGFMWAALSMGAHWWVFGSWFLGLAFLPGLSLTNPFFLNIPAWSLFLEIVANALHGSILSKLNTRMLIGLCGICAAIFGIGGATWDRDLASILWLIPREMCCYLLGIILFRVWGDKPLGRSHYYALASFSVLLLLPSFSAWVAAVVLSPLIVRAALSLERSKLAMWAGALSYPLYATHVPTMKLAKLLGAPMLLAFVIALVVAIAVALAFEVKAFGFRRPRPLLAGGH